MQVIIFVALMVSLVLASPIGRYRSAALRPRYLHERAPYENSTSSITAPIPASSDIASELLVILPSTGVGPSQSFSSAVVPPRSFQNVRDGAPTSIPDKTSSTLITRTRTVNTPVETTKTLPTSSGVSKATSSSRKSFEYSSAASSVVVTGTAVDASSAVVTGSTSDAVVTPSVSLAVPDNTLTASTATGSTSDAVVTPPTSLVAVPDNTLTASTATGSTSDAVVTPPTSLIAVPDNTLTASTVTGSTSDAVVTPPTSLVAVPDNTLTASTVTGSTSDAVVTPSASGFASTQKYEQTSALSSSVRYRIGTTKSVTLPEPATTSTAIVTPEPAVTSPVTTPAVTTPATTTPAVTTPAVTTPVTTTSAAIIPSKPVVPSEPATKSAAIVTPEPVVTSTPVISTASTTQESTPTTSTGASPSAIADDKFGNKKLAIAENKGFAALTPNSKCDPAEPSTQNACINGAFAQCGSDGIYIIVSPCSAPTKCFSMPLELTAGTSVGCTTPDDAAYRMGLANAAELASLVGRGNAGDGTPTGIAPTAATSAVSTSPPVGASTAVSSVSQEPKLPVPSGLTTSEVESSAIATKTIDTPPPAKPTAAISSASQEPKLPVPSGLTTSEAVSPTTHAGEYASSAPTATIDTSSPASTTDAVPSISQEPKLPVPSGLTTSEAGFLPTSIVESPSITSAPVPSPSRVTVTVATTITVKG